MQCFRQASFSLDFHRNMHTSCSTCSCSCTILPNSQLQPRSSYGGSRCCGRAAPAATSNSGIVTGSSSTPGTALQVRRLQQLQDMLSDPTEQQPEQNLRPEKPSSGQRGKKMKAAGFGGGTGSTEQAKQQQQERLRSQDLCPCRSGLRFQDCCQPFLSGQTHPRSAPELARARISAALTGDVSYLVDTTHPDSSLALGGRRDLASKTRSQAAVFKQNKPAVLGMAHCRGDEEGTWLVLAILQATAGQLAGTKVPLMYLMAKRGSKGTAASAGVNGNSSRTAGGQSKAGPDDWLYMGQTNKLPQHDDAEALWQLLQLHVPELLTAGNDEDSAGTSSSMTSREVYFAWSAHALNLPTAPETAARAAARGSSSAGEQAWYLDLLRPAAEPLHAHSRGNGGASSGSSRGVISMDTLIEVAAGRG